MTRPWPPTLPEFCALCRPRIEPETAFVEAVQQLGKRDLNEDTWSHPAIYWAAAAIGEFDLRSASYPTIKARWTDALERELAKGAWPEIPKRPLALPAPIINKAQVDQIVGQLQAMLKKKRVVEHVN